MKLTFSASVIDKTKSLALYYTLVAQLTQPLEFENTEEDRDRVCYMLADLAVGPNFVLEYVARTTPSEDVATGIALMKDAYLQIRTEIEDKRAAALSAIKSTYFEKLKELKLRHKELAMVSEDGSAGWLAVETMYCDAQKLSELTAADLKYRQKQRVADREYAAAAVDILLTCLFGPVPNQSEKDNDPTS